MLICVIAYLQKTGFTFLFNIKKNYYSMKVFVEKTSSNFKKEKMTKTSKLSSPSPKSGPLRPKPSPKPV